MFTVIIIETPQVEESPELALEDKPPKKLETVEHLRINFSKLTYKHWRAINRLAWQIKSK